MRTHITSSTWFQRGVHGAARRALRLPHESCCWILMFQDVFVNHASIIHAMFNALTPSTKIGLVHVVSGLSACCCAACRSLTSSAACLRAVMRFKVLWCAGVLSGSFILVIRFDYAHSLLGDRALCSSSLSVSFAPLWHCSNISGSFILLIRCHSV